MCYKIISTITKTSDTVQEQNSRKENPYIINFWDEFYNIEETEQAYRKGEKPMQEKMVKEVMSRDVISVLEDTSVQEMVSLFTKELISGAPVIDQKGKLLGVVSLSDVAKNTKRQAAIVANKASYYESAWEDKINPEDLDGFHLEIDDDMKVKDIYSRLVIEVSEDTTLAQASSTMIHSQVHRLIVTSRGNIVGIITTTDILKVVAGLHG